MRLMFVHWVVEDRGSPQDIFNYTRAAQAMGHEVALYGRSNRSSPFAYSRDLESADAVIFLFEWTHLFQGADNLDFMRLVAKVPRHRRIVVDLDGKYNDAISVVGDYNHADEAASKAWIDLCESLSDKIFQATPHPLRPNARPFLFHAYSPDWERPLNFAGKKYGMYCVGNNWFRWRAMHRMLKTLEPIRERVGPIGLVGYGWDAPAPWAHPSLTTDAYYTDPDYLKSLGVEVKPPVHFKEVIDGMSVGVFSPVIYRPLFDHLRLVTCRTFETLAANTIPLFTQDAEYVTGIYGDEAVNLLLPEEEPQEKILDILRRPQHYAGLVDRLRQHLRLKHSYEARINELIDIVKS
jgi:glycosyltransferase involved in cell wall biosynthesis